MLLTVAMLTSLELQGRELNYRKSPFLVISMRYPRNHVTHVRVYDTDLAMIEES